MDYQDEMPCGGYDEDAVVEADLKAVSLSQ